MSRGACAGTNDPDAWFPEEGHADRDPRTLAALSTCNGCPVRSECLRHALEHGERYGIWGGMTERQRATFTRRRGAGTGDAA
jgi:WhiB family redox-sensing transcriptional regulator